MATKRKLQEIAAGGSNSNNNSCDANAEACTSKPWGEQEQDKENAAFSASSKESIKDDQDQIASQPSPAKMPKITETSHPSDFVNKEDGIDEFLQEGEMEIEVEELECPEDVEEVDRLSELAVSEGNQKVIEELKDEVQMLIARCEELETRNQELEIFLQEAVEQGAELLRDKSSMANAVEENQMLRSHLIELDLLLKIKNAD
eukprot:TRINITY_DN16949_c0_g1_i1.p1 TRINITY_DN16949_c0_g1~~TRINITY_DN16949_c0_g1_i1.p1  ORF type:complete len:203 (-),score=72.45 TRINITY_DN16949_c0_g1_i1:71-679(-)